MEVNLISDTVTRPSEGMLSVMQQAAVGDDVFKEDPSVNALETKVAALFGKESALFFPSGTMANQTAIKLHTQPGEQLICDHYAHIFNYEGGGVSFNSGVSCATIQGDRGRISAPQIRKRINPADFYHSPKSSLVCLENTTNKGGGAFYDMQSLQSISALCKEENLALHLDGARLWNAMVATQTTAAEYGALFDTLSLCFSKGLGAPVGSVLVGSQAHMDKALRIRKVLGGGMRQAGYLAAAAQYALEHQLDDLKYDHEKAKALEKLLHGKKFVKKVAPVDTNIVIFELEESVSETDFFKKLADKNIKFISMGGGKLRFVTHRDYTDRMHAYVLETLRGIEM